MKCSNANGNKKFTFRRTFELASIKNTITLSVCPSKTLHKYCFYSLLGLTTVLRDLETMLMQTFGGTNIEYFGTFDTG